MLYVLSETCTPHHHHHPPLIIKHSFKKRGELEGVKCRGEGEAPTCTEIQNMFVTSSLTCGASFWHHLLAAATKDKTRHLQLQQRGQAFKYGHMMHHRNIKNNNYNPALPHVSIFGTFQHKCKKILCVSFILFFPLFLKVSSLYNSDGLDTQSLQPSTAL